MTESEIVPYIERTASDMFDISMSLRHMEVLTLTNPQWEISLLKVGQDDVPANTPIITRYVSLLL